jgi:hypothetical protein
MRDAKTYRQYAEECRRIAQTMTGQYRLALSEMAKVWEESAREAERQRRRPGADNNDKN